MKPAIVNTARGVIAICAVLAVAAFIGATQQMGGPGHGHAPEMAEQPVPMPDGTLLYVMKYEVSIAEWNTCHDAGACTLALRVPGNHAESEMPATGLSYVDVSEYLDWINEGADVTFRLPTLMEWEYMAAEVLPEKPDPIFTDPDLTWASAYLMEPQTKRALRARGSFDTTSQGIVDLNGSVWEWTMDCYSGSAKSEITRDHCPAFFVGGEHIAAVPLLVRDPARGGCAVGTPPAHLGMRLVSDGAPKARS